MNQKIYVIAYKKYFDEVYQTEIIGVTDDYNKGSDYVKKMNELYKSKKNKLDNFHYVVMRKWFDENPIPDYKLKEERNTHTKNYGEFCKKWKKENLTKEELSLEEFFDEMIYFIQESKWF
jgi:hypothetical protein